MITFFFSWQHKAFELHNLGNDDLLQKEEANIAARPCRKPRLGAFFAHWAI